MEKFGNVISEKMTYKNKNIYVMNNFPSDVLRLIAELLNPQSFVYFSRTCKKISAAMRDEYFQNLMKKKFSFKQFTDGKSFVTVLPSGIKHGLEEIYNTRVGNILFRCFWENGKKEGEQMKWWYIGPQRQRSRCFWKNGIKHGEKLKWHYDGIKLSKRYIWENGRCVGLGQEWNWNGAMTKKVSYGVDGCDEETIFYDSGFVWMVRQRKNNRLFLENIYNIHGFLSLSRFWKSPSHIEETMWDGGRCCKKIFYTDNNTRDIFGIQTVE
jgi:antitoxin component YwqK of YwqJK toxin-antitoxin module